MKINDKISFAVRAVALVLMLLSSFFMYDFYKCFLGFVVNGFREPFVMLPMILAFFLPVFSFLFFFYEFFVGEIKKCVKIGYSLFVIAYALAVLVMIFAKIKLYASNNALGVYDSLPSIVLRFPYDMILVLFALIALEVLNLVTIFKKGTRAEAIKSSIKQQGSVKISVLEYLLLSPLAIIGFVFTGSGITATFSSFSNVFYSIKFVYLLVLVTVIPLGNVLFLELKPENLCKTKRSRLAFLGTALAVNLVFALLFLIFELTHPDFIVHIGKPLFLIAFAVSMPVEPAIIFAVMAISSVIYILRLVSTVRKSSNK